MKRLIAAILFGVFAFIVFSAFFFLLSFIVCWMNDVEFTAILAFRHTAHAGMFLGGLGVLLFMIFAPER
jgi:hypothetical protein